jgi:hypothetical protein
MLGADVGVVVGGGVLPLFIVSSHQTRTAIRTRTTTHSHMGTPSRRRTVTSFLFVMDLSSYRPTGASFELGCPM